MIVKLSFFFRNNLCEILVNISLQPKAKLKELNKNKIILKKATNPKQTKFKSYLNKKV